MTISAKVIADSISPHGIRLVTVLCRYPRFIHAELMTHRMFSRNASSSRAIPVERLIEDIIRDTAMPIHWGKNQPGMQAHEEHDANVHIFSADHGMSKEGAWFAARDKAIEVARAFHIAGYHKQIVNRLLEPFSHINVLITATEWNNFFALRAHKDAQPEIHELALQIFNAMAGSQPTHLKPGEWHLPFVDAAEKFEIAYGDSPSMGAIEQKFGIGSWQAAIRVSVARCARTSYLTHDGKKPDIEQDLALYDRLVGSVPLHASPAEHQATPDVRTLKVTSPTGWEKPQLHGNLRGWIQYRKTLPNENQA